MSDLWNSYHRFDEVENKWEHSQQFSPESGCDSHIGCLDMTFHRLKVADDHNWLRQPLEECLLGFWLILAPDGSYRSYSVEDRRGVYAAVGHVGEEEGKTFIVGYDWGIFPSISDIPSNINAPIQKIATVMNRLDDRSENFASLALALHMLGYRFSDGQLSRI